MVEESNELFMVTTRVRMCEVKRSVSGSATEHTRTRKDGGLYDTECFHNFKSDGRQSSTELGAKASNTAPPNYMNLFRRE